MSHKNLVFLVVVFSVAILMVVPIFSSCAPAKEVVPPEAKPPSSEESAIPPGATVELSMLIDFTGPGTFAAQPHHDGTFDYFKYVNETKGGIDGVKIDFKAMDTGYKIPVGLAAYEKFKEEGRPFEIGSLTAFYEALKENYASDEIFCLTASTSCPTISPPGWVFSSMCDHASGVGTMVKWWKENKWKGDGNPKWASLSVDSAVGLAPFTDKFMAFLEDDLDMEFVGIEYCAYTPADVTNQLVGLRQKGIDLLYIGLNEQGAAVTLKDMDKLGMLSEVDTAACWFTAGQEVPIVAGNLAEGFRCCSEFSLWPDVDVEGIKLAHELVDKYRGGDEEYKFSRKYYVTGVLNGIIAERLIKETLKQEGYPITGPALKRTAEKLDTDTLGITYGCDWSPTERRATRHIKVYEVQGGKAVAQTKWLPAVDLLSPTIAIK